MKAVDHATNRLSRYRSDFMARRMRVRRPDPECGMAHVSRDLDDAGLQKPGSFTMDRAAAQTAAPLLRHATAREQVPLGR